MAVSDQPRRDHHVGVLAMVLEELASERWPCVNEPWRSPSALDADRLI